MQSSINALGSYLIKAMDPGNANREDLRFAYQLFDETASIRDISILKEFRLELNRLLVFATNATEKRQFSRIALRLIEYQFFSD